MRGAHLTRSSLLRGVTATCSLSAWACGTGAASPDALFATTDSADVTIAQNSAPDRTRDLLVSTEPALQIGVLEGAEEYQLFQVGDVVRQFDGSIVIVNGGTREVRIYDPNGSHRATVGGAGDGPSEFRYPASVFAVEENEILVQDMFDLVRFTAQGSFVERKSMGRERFGEAFSGGGMAEFGNWMPDGSMFVPVYTREPTPWTPGRPYRPVMTLVRVSSDLSGPDTLGLYGGIQQQMLEIEGRVSSYVAPFGENTSWSFGARNGTLVIGDNASPEFHLFSADGNKRIVRWVQDPSPVAPGEISAWLDVQRAADWTQSRLPTLERAWASMEMPRTKALYSGVMIGGDGHVWVVASPDRDSDPTDLLMFSPEGRYEGFVSIPGRFQPHDGGASWIVGVYRDENDVEYVRLYELHHPVD